MTSFDIRSDIPIPSRTSEEYTVGTKIDTELPTGCSVFVSGVNSQKLSVRLRRLNKDKSYSIRKELSEDSKIEGYRVYRIK